MKHNQLLVLLSALMLSLEDIQAHPTHQAHHPIHRSPLDTESRDIPVDPLRSISRDPKNIPVEPV